MTEDEMVGWHHRLNGQEFEQAPGVGDGQGGLMYCSPWCRRVRHDLATEHTLLSSRIVRGPDASGGHLENLGLRSLMGVCPVLFTF